MIEAAVLGQRLLRLRELKGLSLSALSGLAGISKSYLAKLERGEVENPGLQTLQAIAAALDSTLAELLSDPDEATKSTATSKIGNYEVLLDSLPAGLKEFIAQKTQEGDTLPADVIHSMASIQFRGKRPRTVSDWDFLYKAIQRSML